MPPTRGHDLKPGQEHNQQRNSTMPPTRGHDLKPLAPAVVKILENDAPHTGARLETLTAVKLGRTVLMPPTRGHDLKL